MGFQTPDRELAYGLVKLCVGGAWRVANAEHARLRHGWFLREETVKNFLVEQIDEIPAVSCPCGMSRRGFLDPGNTVGTLHCVDISETARVHYHKRLTETYLVLEGEGYLELDGERVPVRPMTAVMIRPGCRHRAVGDLRIVHFCSPPFDPNDEWFDDEEE